MIFLKFDTAIKGDSNHADHKDWITISSYQFVTLRNENRLSGGQTRQFSNPFFSEMTFTCPTSIASPELFIQSLCGETLKKATIEVTRTGGTKKHGEKYITILLHEPVITGYETSLSSDAIGTDNFTIAFTKFNYKYNEYDSEKVTKTTDKGWDVEQSKTV